MSLTATDLSSIRTIVHEESRDVFQTEGKAILHGIFHNEGRAMVREVVKEEVKDIFQTEGRKVMLNIFQNEGKEIIRDIFQTDGRRIAHETVKVELSSLDGKVTALENDVKEIYFILTRIDKKLRSFHKFQVRTDMRLARLESGRR